MSEKISDSLKIAEVLTHASNAEKSEFDRRLFSFIQTSYSLKNLVSQHNHLQKLHEEKLKEQSKSEIIFTISIVVAIAIGISFSTASLQGIQALIFVGLIVAIYLIKKDTYEKTYVLQFRMFELEIDRLNNELKQYCYLLLHENRLVEEEPLAQGVILEKWREQREQAFDELKLEILKSMYLLPKN